MTRSERKGPALEEGIPMLMKVLAFWVSMTPVWPITNVWRDTLLHPKVFRL